MVARFSKKWVNPLYFILNDLLKDDTIRTILIYGGKSSSKTVSIVQLLAKEAVVKQSSCLAFRKESTIIRTTLKKSFKLAIDSMYLYTAFETFDLAFKCEGAEIILKGLDDEEKAKGVESYKYIYLDELNHFTEAEYSQFQLSLRGIRGQKIFGSWNPVDENSWVKTELIDNYEFLETEYKLPCENSFVKKSTCGKVVLIKTTYEDNYWISGSPCGTYGYRDENLISEYNDLKQKNYNRYKVNVLGEWGKVVFGGEIMKCWKSEVHIGNYEYNPDLAVYLSFDENVNPYFPCGFFQIQEDQKTVYMIYEIAAKNPNNTVRWICGEISRKLRQWQHKGKLYIGGDATSQKSDVKQEKGHDLFRLIISGLEEFKPIRKVSTSNPSVIMSFEFLNSILSDNVQGMSFYVDSQCKTAILDYENTKEDKNGKIDKKTVIDPLTKISYQPYGHWCDLTRYMITTNFAQEYAKYQSNSMIPTISTGTDLFKRIDRF